MMTWLALLGFLLADALAPARIIRSSTSNRHRGVLRSGAGGDDDAIADLLRRAAALREDGAPPGGAPAPPPRTEAEIMDDRRRRAEALAAELSGDDVGDKVSGDDAARRAVPRTDRPASDQSAWPKFGAAKKPPAAPFGGALGGGALDNVAGAPGAELTAADMEDPELRALVRRQMVNAFDNYPPQEVEAMFARLWAAGPIKSVRKLVEAARDADAVETAYFEGAVSDERAGDEIRVCRSRLRMYGKDAEFLPNADGSPGARDMWGDLDDWLPWRWKPEAPS